MFTKDTLLKIGHFALLAWFWLSSTLFILYNQLSGLWLLVIGGLGLVQFGQAIVLHRQWSKMPLLSKRIYPLVMASIAVFALVAFASVGVFGGLRWRDGLSHFEAQVVGVGVALLGQLVLSLITFLLSLERKHTNVQPA